MGVQALSARELAQGYRDSRVLAKPRPGMAPMVDRAEQAEGFRLRAHFERFGAVRILGLASGENVMDAVGRLRATGRYEYVEPDYVRHSSKVPGDTRFSEQWALMNTGANGGIVGADIHASGGWDVLTNAGAKVVVGVLDSGALLNHEDLAANLWVNPAPGTTASYATNGSSSSMVSETDSANGLNAVAKTGPPTDDLGHGTHVSGIVGAVGNNGLGVSGVAWAVQLMELKFIDKNDNGAVSDLLPCLEYAIAHKVSVLNASFGGATFSQAEMDAIQAAGKAGIIFVCAAGNAAENIDISPSFPSDYPLDNIISVGATDNRDQPVYFTNYGSGSVELFAPGEGILSTFFSGASSYAFESGTSMSAPFVTGAVALLRTQFPGDTYRQAINRILNSADPIPALAGKAQTGGRLNLARALTSAANTPPNALFANRVNLVGLDPYTRSNNADSPATPEAGPTPITPAGGHALWWQWTAPEDATVEIDTSGTNGGTFPGGSTYPTALGVYTGAGLNSLTLVKSSENFGTEPLEGGGGSTVSFSEVKFHTQAGTTYQITVQGQGGASGQTILAINTTPDNDSVQQPRVLSGPSVSVNGANPNATRESGEPLILGNAGGHSLWYAWTAPKAGPVQAAAYSIDFLPAVAVYSGSSIGSLSLLASAAASAKVGTSSPAGECLCTFNAAAGVTYLISVDGVGAADFGGFTLTVSDSRWQAVTRDSVTCSPALGPDGTLYIGSNDKSLYAIDQAGNVKWAHAAGGVFDTSSAAVASDGTIYAGNADGNLYAFRPDGSVLWTKAAGASASNGGITSSPALASDGTIYVHAGDGNLYAFNADGSTRWTAPVPGFSYAAPTIASDGTIYVGTDGGAVYAIKSGGTQKWKYTAPGTGESIYTAAAIDASGNLYFGTLGGNVYSLDPAGNQRWSLAIGNGVTSAPALANGSVYFGGYDGRLYSVSQSGAVQWTFQMGAQVRASGPAVDANGVIYIGSYDHTLYAVSPQGALVRTYATSDYIRSSPAIFGTSLYFGSTDHKIYAFDIGAAGAASDWPMYQYDSRRIGRLQLDPLLITAQPVAQSLVPGSSLLLSVSATGPGALSYQWSRNGAPIAGAVNSTYTVFSASVADSGTYTVTITGPSGSVTSTATTVVVAAAPPPAPGPAATRIVNLSARANVGTAGNILIAGFVIRGAGSKNVVLRGIGPTLATAPFNVASALAAPQLTLLDSATQATLGTSAAWGGATALANAFVQVGAFALAPGSADAAVEKSFAPGAYTSQISGANSTSGIALAEIYDADTGSPASSLVNISARANVGPGADVLIAGFVIQGDQPAKVLLRGIGPTLGTAPFNLQGVLAQPVIDLYNAAGAKLSGNAGWNGDPALAAAFTAVGAFGLAAGSADAAMIATLPAGSYTLQLSGQGGGSGIGLVEVYLIP